MAPPARRRSSAYSKEQLLNSRFLSLSRPAFFALKLSALSFADRLTSRLADQLQHYRRERREVQRERILPPARRQCLGVEAAVRDAAPAVAGIVGVQDLFGAAL